MTRFRFRVFVLVRVTGAPSHRLKFCFQASAAGACERRRMAAVRAIVCLSFQLRRSVTDASFPQSHGVARSIQSILTTIFVRPFVRKTMKTCFVFEKSFFVKWRGPLDDVCQAAFDEYAAKTVSNLFVTAPLRLCRATDRALLHVRFRLSGHRQTERNC